MTIILKSTFWEYFNAATTPVYHWLCEIFRKGMLCNPLTKI